MLIKDGVFKNHALLPCIFLPSSFPRQSVSPKLKFLSNQSLRSFHNFRLLHFQQKLNLKVIAEKDFDASELVSGGFSGVEDTDLPLEFCHTRTLPPALTLEHGVLEIKQVVEKLKSNPLCSASGILRLQVAVPASTKALNWLCSQPQSLGAFPQFYLSKRELQDPSCDLFPLEGHGISGIGSAVYFTGPCLTPKVWGSIKRYVSDSPLIRPYGFMGISFDTKSSSLKYETGSFYFFIPQIELDELESNFILAATLAWNESLYCPFDKAVESFEFRLNQAIYCVSPSLESSYHIWINFIQRRNFILTKLKNVQMVHTDVHSLGGNDTGSDHVLPEEAPSSHQFYFRLSLTMAFTCNLPDSLSKSHCSVQDCANINAVWSSLIIEECTRLGLTYFCIAPGSRSSPLAVAASSHPLTTCISCFDERALAFHAVGYARGSYRPAVVITSSGTAVSNLLPAVVEASQDFLPLLLLTADRPPELQDAGANQAINQVNHFGSFVRFFFSLPPPTDHIPARMVLTTVDSAVYFATHAPHGPVHINCPFREPLEDSPKEWASNCLKGLDFWMLRAEPFTKYISVKQFHACNGRSGEILEVLEVIKHASRGLLLLGAIHTEDELWAALLLAKHLSWPVAADILSGLRLRKALTSFPEVEANFLYIDNLDHALLSDLGRAWVKPDTIIQIGSKITSKRVAQMLEECSMCSYILVDKHPYRHDPSHIVTYRIQSSITEFADTLIRAQLPRKPSKWGQFLQIIDKMVAEEVGFQIYSECSLTEPYVARVTTEALAQDAALFVGNSMVIRDCNMYGQGWVKSAAGNAPRMSSCETTFEGIRVAGNRGASGIDGLLSTAIGFAVGCNRRVICLIGDVSFLHDTNGLAILNQRIRRKPLTIIVVNNHGGAIFSLLPIANQTQPSLLNRFFYTSHSISIGKLCQAHSVKHLHVRTRMELEHALLLSGHAPTDYVIEVESCIEDNATFHSILMNSARQAADHALRILSRLSVPDHVCSSLFLGKIKRMEYSLYRIELCAPHTSTPSSCNSEGFYREGFILTLSLNDGSVGFGEVAPMEIHKEKLQDVEEQLRCILHLIQGAEISYLLPLRNGSFSSWIWERLGIKPCSIFPSVRCGLEMAVLNALAERQGSSLSSLLLGCEISSQESASVKEDETMERMSRVQICALIDSDGTPKDVASIAAKLFEEGFTTIKLKVARRSNPLEDAAVIQEIRQKIGYKIKIRADANQKWTFEQAIQFASAVKCCDLQYIEEPVVFEDDIIRFCEETGLPAALDESIDGMHEDPLNMLSVYKHPGIVAVVIKPNVVGGFENAALIAKWAQQHDKMAVISSAFESSLSLSVYIQFANYLEQQYTRICRVKDKETKPTIAHGLGTYRWLKEDVTAKPLKTCVHSHGDKVEVSVQDAALLLRNFRINHEIIQRSYMEEEIQTYRVSVNCQGFSYSLKVREAGKYIHMMQDKVIIFLHGFLGTGEDWIPIMKSLSVTARCISVDLPGHGESQIQNCANEEGKVESSVSIEVVADVLHKLIQEITPGRVVLVGYSMGARVALYMALRCSKKIGGAVIISGSPGLKDEAMRKIRTAQDDSKARYLSAHGLQCFLDMWYAGDIWNSLRNHPYFGQIVESRAHHDDVSALAKALSGLSVGRQPSLWEDLKQCTKPLLFIVGEKDRKFKEIAHQMCQEISNNPGNKDNEGKKIHEMIEVSDCGHAVHVESPLSVINSLRKLLTNLEV
ncbi:protein PHYLLO, chloroplastic isoform X2 [Telopea speciosissima]|uniref:protein PHYLLO, chloroplastic isoform X2 n=1 Tax=Telopea speciosissima TaxID=54955 RepID=UPI001CC54061|nr:protein PHYLLO, chloroplastic isoform X2 [Telopea speciosissima]